MSWIDDLGRHLIYIFDACFAPLVYIPFNVGVFFSQKRFVGGTEMMCMGASCEHGVGGVRGRRRALVVVWSGLVWFRSGAWVDGALCVQGVSVFDGWPRERPCRRKWWFLDTKGFRYSDMERHSQKLALLFPKHDSCVPSCERANINAHSTRGIGCGSCGILFATQHGIDWGVPCIWASLESHNVSDSLRRWLPHNDTNRKNFGLPILPQGHRFIQVA
jgi:hypothetical protein